MVFLFLATASNTVLSALIASIASLCSWAIRSPHLTHVLWVLVLVKLVTPPLISIPFALPQNIQATQRQEKSLPEKFLRSSNPTPIDLLASVASTKSDSLGPPGTATNPFMLDEAEKRWGNFRSLSVGMLLIWIVGSVCTASLLLLQTIRFHGIVAKTEEASDSHVALVSSLAQKLSLSYTPEIRITSEVISPTVWALFSRPTIVLPSLLLASLSPIQQSSLLTHELAHVKRRDHVVRWIEAIAKIVCWWNPIVWFASDLS